MVINVSQGIAHCPAAEILRLTDTAEMKVDHSPSTNRLPSIASKMRTTSNGAQIICVVNKRRSIHLGKDQRFQEFL